MKDKFGNIWHVRAVDPYDGRGREYFRPQPNPSKGYFYMSLEYMAELEFLQY